MKKMIFRLVKIIKKGEIHSEKGTCVSLVLDLLYSSNNADFHLTESLVMIGANFVTRRS